MFKGGVSGGVCVLLVLGAAVLGGFWPTERASATTFSWTAASGIDLNWSDNANWNPAGPVSGGTILFNNTGGTTDSSVTSIVDSSFNISSLTVACSGTSFVQNLSIPNLATTLSVTGAGNVVFGSTAFGNSSAVTSGSLSIAGSGALVINNPAANFIVGPGSSVASSAGFGQGVNMSGLDGFSFSGGSFSVGANTGGTVRSSGGTLQLATSSSITATTQIDVGDNTSATNAGKTSVLDLGAVTNTINANTFFVGHGKANGTLVFGSTAATPPIVTIRGASGGNSRVSTFDIGDHSQSTANNIVGLVDFSSGQVNAIINSLTIGAAANNGGNGGGTGTFIMGPNPNNLVDVNTISMALATTSSHIATGTLLVEGGTLAFGTIGVSANQTATITFSGGSTICSNTASSMETPNFNLGANGASSTVTFGALAGTYSGSLTFNGAATLSGNTTLQVYSPTTINGSIGGGNVLTMGGPGLLVLGGSDSTYFGGTTVNGGTLQLTNGGALGSGSVGVNGGILDIHGNSFTNIGPVTLAGGSIINSGSAGASLSASGYTLVSGTASAALAGGGAALLMNGPGLALLSGSNSYGGGTTVSGGTLQLGNPSALGNSGGGLQVSGGVLDLNGQTVTTGGLGGNGGSITSTANGGVLVLTPGVPTTYSGTITGQAGITLNAPFVAQALGAANNYTGPTTVSAGTLALAAPGTLGSGLTAITPGATLDVSSYNPGGYNFSSGTLAAGPTPLGGTDINGSLNVAGALLSITGGTNSTMTINGNLALNGGTVSLAQASTIVLAGGGALSLAAHDVIEPTGQLSNGTYTLFTYGSLAAGGISDLAVGGPFASARQTYTFATSGGMALTLTVSGFNANLQWVGGSNHTWDTGSSKSWFNPAISGLDFFYGGDNVTFNDTPGTATTVTINGNVGPGALTVTNTNVAYTFSGTGSIVGATSLNMTGPGTLTINTNNGYTGGTSLGGGLLNLGTSGALGSGTLAISGGSLNNTSGAAMTLGGNIPQAWNSNFAFVGSNPLNLGTGPVALGTSPTVTVAGTGALTVGGPINDGGSGYALTIPGPGTLALGGSNGYGGGTNLNGGLLVINNNSALGSGSLAIGGGSIDSTSGGVTVAGNTQNWNASFAFLGSQNLNLGTGAVTLGSSVTVTVNAGVLTVAGAIGDNGSGYSLTKASSGTLNLGGQNTYGADTIIANGTLQLGVSGAIPTGAGAGNVDFTSAANSAVLDLNGVDTTINGLSQPTPSTTNLVVNNLPLSGTHTITVGNYDATSIFAGVLEDNTGSGGQLALAKIGTGMLTLGGTNLYTGPTSISGGTLALLTGSPLSGATALNFSGTSVVNLNANSQTLSNMTFVDNTLATITGTTGSSLTCSPASLLIEPASSSATFLTLDMSGAGPFTYHNPSGTVNIGSSGTAGTGTATVVTTTLSAGTNAITASVLDVGSNATSNGVPDSKLFLGASNTLAVNTINVGVSNNRPEGTVAFAPGLVNPMLRITGASGGTSTANLNIGQHDSFQLSDTAIDTFNTTPGTLYAQLGTVTIGVERTTKGTNRGMTFNSSLQMGAGALSAGSMTIGMITAGGTSASPYNFSDSGSFTVAGGTADVTTLTLATNNYVFGVNGGTSTLDAEVTLNGGAYLYAATIQEGPISPVSSGTLNVSSQVNLNRGTIGNLTGGSLNMSVPSLVVSGTGDQDAFLISAGEIGDVSSTISGSGAIASIGPGTLILSGTDNTFTGGLFDSNGTVILTNSKALAAGDSLIVGNVSGFAAPLLVETPAAPVPEPGTLMLALATLASAVVFRRVGRSILPEWTIRRQRR